MNPYSLFPSPRSAAAKRIQELSARRAELQVEHSRVTAEHDRLTQEREAHEAAIRTAEARMLGLGGKEDLASARKALGQTIKELDSLNPAPLAGAIAAVEAEVERVLTESVDELQAEVSEDAQAAASALVDALEHLTTARDMYRSTWVRADAFTRLVNDPALAKGCGAAARDGHDGEGCRGTGVRRPCAHASEARLAGGCAEGRDSSVRRHLRYPIFGALQRAPTYRRPRRRSTLSAGAAAG